MRNVPQRVRAALRKACHFYADDLTLVKEVEREKRAARLAQRELDTDLHQLRLFGKERLLEFEPKKSQGLVVSNTKRRNVSPTPRSARTRRSFTPPPHGKNHSQREEEDGNSWFDY